MNYPRYWPRETTPLKVVNIGCFFAKTASKSRRVKPTKIDWQASYTWRTASGAFDDPNNWNLAIIPGSADTAVFNANGGTISHNGSVAAVAFSGASWAIADQLTTNASNVLNGSVSVDGSNAQLLVTATFSVGGSGAFNLLHGGTLSVTQGATIGPATLTVSSRAIADFNGALSLAAAAGSTVATIDAATLTVGGVFQFGAVAGGSATLVVKDGGVAAVNAAANNTTNDLQLGAVAGGSGVVEIEGTGSLLLVTQNSAGIGVAGAGQLLVGNGGMARITSTNSGLNPALVIGVQRYSSGYVAVSGSGSSIVVGGSVIVAEAGAGTLSITGGASVTSSSATSTQAALAVAAAGFGVGTLVIDGSGSQLQASGAAFVGADNRGSGTTGGGTGSISVTEGGSLQTGAMTVEVGSSIVVDGTSQEGVGGDLILAGTLASSGTLYVSGAVAGSGTLQLGGGLASVGALVQANVQFTTSDAALRISYLGGTSQVTGMQFGDEIDQAGNSNVSVSGNVVSTSTGSLVLGGSGPYTLSNDGSGGTFVTLGVATIGVFRFFDSNYGTHFFSASTSEKASIIQTRPDLVYEGVGLESIDPNAADPNASSVYRFFDTSYGTHFFTASAAERDTVIATRPDLTYEGTGFIEHTLKQPGDVAVYRFFDTHYGTHFYTADANEHATIVATRPDLVDEGTGFYAPGT